MDILGHESINLGYESIQNLQRVLLIYIIHAQKTLSIRVTQSELESIEIHGDHYLEQLNGLHFHTLCEEDADALEKTASLFEEQFGAYLEECHWLNFGGGHHITRPGYNLDLLKEIILHFKNKYKLSIYLEPGEAVALQTGVLNAQILDVLKKILNHCYPQLFSYLPYARCTRDALQAQMYLGAGAPNEKAYSIN